MTVTSAGDVLHEREAELAQLRRALERALDGHGGAVLVEGSAGIGKTRLLDEACRMAEGRARVLRARGGEQERDIPLLVTRELFTPYVASAPPDELERVFAGAAALAGPLLGRGTADAGTADAAFALTHGLYWLIANLADEQPLLLAVDDVHWADESSQRWLAYVLPRIEELPVLLVMAARPRELAPDGPLALGLASAPGLVPVRPVNLSPDAAAGVVQSLLPAATPGFCRAAHRSTSGNPLLLRSLAREVTDRGLEPSDDAARRLDEIGAVGIARIVLPRLHALGSDAVELARAVSVLGDGRQLADAAELAGMGRDDAASAYDRLVAAEVVRGDGLAFTHPLVRAAVSEEVPPGRRSALHLRAARVLEARGADPEDVARHLAATDAVREDWVVPVLREAAALATSRGAPEAALRHLDALLREDLDRGTRCAILLDAGWQAFRVGDVRGRAWLEEALDLATDPSSAVLAWLAVWNWRLVMLDGHDPDSFRSGLPEALDGDLSYVVAGNALLDMGFSGAGLRSAEDLLPDVPPRGVTMAERLCLCGLAMDETITCGSSERAADSADRAWAAGGLLEEAGDLPNPSWALLTMAAAGRLDLALERSQEALAQVTRRGSLLPTEWYVVATGITQMLCGEFAGADATMLTWLEGQELRSAVTLPVWAGALAELHVERGRPDQAIAVLDQWGLLDRDPRSDWPGAYLLDCRGRVSLRTGRFADALGDFQRCGEVLASFGGRRSAFPAWRVGAAAALTAVGRATEARELAEDQVADARRWGALPLLGRSLSVLAEAIGAEEAIQPAEEAADVLGRSEARAEHARALLVLGRLLRLDRQPARAREVLEPALESAERLGARLLADQVEQELRLAGARPRRRTVTGVQALTPAELRVATFAAQGLSNPEIAQSLFVTRKTVEKHLGSAFAKLHISSRDQLPAVLEQR